MTELPLRKLQALFGDKLQENVRMANYTTTRVGGPASGLISVYTADEMRRTVKILWELDAPFRILGSGSNLLVSDSGYKGVMVHNRCHNVRIAPKANSPLSLLKAERTSARFRARPACGVFLGLSGLTAFRAQLAVPCMATQARMARISPPA